MDQENAGKEKYLKIWKEWMVYFLPDKVLIIILWWIV